MSALCKQSNMSETRSEQEEKKKQFAELVRQLTADMTDEVVGGMHNLTDAQKRAMTIRMDLDLLRQFKKEYERISSSGTEFDREVLYAPMYKEIQRLKVKLQRLLSE